MSALTASEYERNACGWCKQLVHWPSQEDMHRYGVCIGNDPVEGSEPIAVLTIHFDPRVSGDDVRRLARSWAAQISTKQAAAEVHVATRHTAEPTTREEN